MTTIKLGRLGQITLSGPDKPNTTESESETDAPVSVTKVPAAPLAEVSDSDDKPAPRRWPRLAAVAVAGIVAAAMAVTGIILAIDNRHREDVHDASGPLKSTVAATVVSMLSYDHKSVADDLAKADPGLTPEFRKEYTSLTKETIVSAAKEKRVITKVTVVGNSIIKQSANKAELLLFLNQVTTTAENSDPTTTGSRVEVVAVRSDGRWLVDSLRPV
ncbi:hypothetical protein [Gordonia sp. (in: high G+C Gram-positive bacteria)]|uniref:hypothetical protein n=1 Tax=Gordonia sp. (in: high G+C Gram-positive bacteria) TaxID=84139 RepID=UPI001D636601|nr:hypothetical protein [Gordonia sp. (in: high G+C Gram-positive bacteria)]MCB1296527.1 hypothetical protein [Gordonia sp. (in: high G+C Gram-positive bacteria)]HMS75531.1 hypothetical protein [Gordonia sp. (in: high G+C Gram-positive bacteria)]HQV18265.1 hypothetical protein [Gordonia sp. (in: high G+C Gram-positive bacteria)]